jgi:hypothetical protein
VVRFHDGLRPLDAVNGNDDRPRGVHRNLRAIAAAPPAPQTLAGAPDCPRAERVVPIVTAPVDDATAATSPIRSVR